MKTKYTLAFVFCVLSVSAFMGWLYASSSLSDDVLRNSFNRLIAPIDYLKQQQQIDLRHNSFYIAGIDNDYVYLGNHTRPFLVTTIDRKTFKQTRTVIKLDDVDSIKDPGYFRLVVTPEAFYLSHGVAPAILSGKTGAWVAKKLQVDKNDYFDQNIPISEKSFAQRFYSKTQNGFALAKMTISNSTVFQPREDLLQRQREGVFSVDGKMHYDRKLYNLVYLYHYRNQFMVCDSNLNLLHRKNTIDTFSVARVQVANIKSDGSSMISAPALQTSKASFVSDGRLFIESNLLAKNEDSRLFEKNSIIDVYNIANGKYTQSFYIKSIENKKPSDIDADENTLLAIIDRYLIIYTMGNDE